MFGNRRKMAVNAAVLVARPLIEGLKNCGDYREDLWQDAYALGYLFNTMAFAMHWAIGSKGLALEDLGRAAQESISGLDGVEIMRRVSNFRELGDHDFQEGMQNAKKVLIEIYSIEDQSGDADVRKAVNRVKADKLSNDGVSAALVYDLFALRVKTRGRNK